ncbi:MAG TPA: hypothetical protein VNA89_12435 [Gemmatimonadaceae bacterium]|nr:hypothetical protein [Gemmatimonadaceae bacterium]
MRAPLRPSLIALAAALAACSTEKSSDRPAADSAAGAAVAADADPDRVVAGGGIPSGFTARTDTSTRGGGRARADVSGIRFAGNNGRIEVTTGPAHILYDAKTSASGNYTASTTIEQLEAPEHPEAFGMFVGGRGLDGPEESYTYFVVRGGGEYLIRQRSGATTKDVVNWTASDAVPKQDASGRATYRLAIRVARDSVHFLVNDRPVAAVPKGTLPTDGVAGLRVNHNLHVAATPVAITRS